MIVFDPRRRIYVSSKISNVFVSGFGTRLSNDLDIPAPRRYIMKQSHGDDVVVVKTINDLERDNEDVDGVVTGLTEVALTVRSADCVPLLFADETAGIIGTSHQGWRGALLKLPEKMVRVMVKQGAVPKNIQVAIGPAIGSCCYEIWGDRLKQFQSTFTDYSDRVILIRKGKNYLNLAHLVYLQLVAAAILPDNIDYFPFCTSCHKEHFYSYNRDRTKQTMVSFISKI